MTRLNSKRKPKRTLSPSALGSLICLLLVAVPVAISAAQTADSVLVDKSEKRLYLIKNDKVFRTLSVTFGGEPRGHKQQQGDQRTPEGRYTLDYKNPNSKYYKSIHISYPNAEDRARARKRGVSPGGDIMLHGQPNGWGWASPVLQLFTWTDGCIALSNRDMDEVWQAVDAGIPIVIRP